MINRRKIDGAWLYQDPVEHGAAITLGLVTGFDLSAWDDLIEKAEASGCNTRFMIGERERLLTAYRSGGANSAKDIARLMAGLMREGRLLPMAEMGRNYGPAQAARRKGKPAADPDDKERNERVKKYHARLVADGHHDATSRTATEFDKSTRTIRRILAD